jgi:CheY-like chemotaxis protein
MHRLLIIDDDASVRKLLRFRLQDTYEIIDTADSQEGLALALQEKPDAILLDLMMPTYSGLEVCQTLSSLSFTHRIPIFIVSAASTARYEEFCANLGAMGFFHKPVDFDKLRKELAEAIQGKHSARPEVRIRLKATLNLSGLDSSGAPFELITVTQNVTTSGFLCGCQAEVKEGAIVEVYLEPNKEQFVGKARVVRVDWPGAPSQACDFQFIEKPANWVLS